MTAPTAELTRNPVDGSWGYICTEHGLHRHGLPEQHARNVEAKHLREDHADPLAITVNLSEAARSFLHYNDQGSLSVWTALVGGLDMPYDDVVDLAKNYAGAQPDVTASVAPF